MIDSFYGPIALMANLIHMADKPLRHYIFASDFDQTLTFNDSGYVLSELVGIPTAEFERKAKGMAKINLVQQGAELTAVVSKGVEGAMGASLGLASSAVTAVAVSSELAERADILRVHVARFLDTLGIAASV